MDKVLEDVMGCVDSLLKELQIPQNKVEPDMSLMKSGLISSMDCLALLLDLESKGYPVQHIDVDMFDSPISLTKLIQKKLKKK